MQHTIARRLCHGTCGCAATSRCLCSPAVMCGMCLVFETSKPLPKPQGPAAEVRLPPGGYCVYTAGGSLWRVQCYWSAKPLAAGREQVRPSHAVPDGPLLCTAAPLVSNTAAVRTAIWTCTTFNSLYFFVVGRVGLAFVSTTSGRDLCPGGASSRLQEPARALLMTWQLP